MGSPAPGPRLKAFLPKELLLAPATRRGRGTDAESKDADVRPAGLCRIRRQRPQCPCRSAHLEMARWGGGLGEGSGKGVFSCLEAQPADITRESCLCWFLVGLGFLHVDWGFDGVEIAEDYAGEGAIVEEERDNRWEVVRCKLDDTESRDQSGFGIEAVCRDGLQAQ
ncbi:uncharacterized protein MKZ38_009173 [Zalerion maritima]|uniref:Uncharacterized protein n=1 Tax=Zalerion maritima TaxID=339359 RepID=A0AAD5RTP4_9PEZI|nr:uncharacterized protein MKZ38_009173 [Zalerion maritima]